MRNLFFLAVIAILLAATTFVFAEESAEPVMVPVFDHQVLHFNPDSTDLYVDAPVVALDNGREAMRPVTLSEYNKSTRILAHLTLDPIPKDMLTVHDRWDRAGNVRLTNLDGPDVEIARFMTSYGGHTEHTLDVTHLAPLLQGQRDLVAFVDTWVSPGWQVTFDLEFLPDTSAYAPDWALPVYYTTGMNAQDDPDGVDIAVTIPPGLARVALVYISTGHCTDGRDEDEFYAKPNVISVDGMVVERLHPWREDCRDYRDRNPYTAKWTDGTWSSDYSRSGWCPGVEVEPTVIDLTGNLTAGEHTLHIEVENMRPIDEEDHFGYWRISAHLVGWKEYPLLWIN
ncbi:hypothetical protein KQI52_06290 [bacterium]|nr:hypothetical protein [bacterium]